MAETRKLYDGTAEYGAKVACAAIVPSPRIILLEVSCVEDSFEFSESVKAVPKPDHVCPYDMVSLFTNVPIIDTIDICVAVLFECPDLPLGFYRKCNYFTDSYSEGHAHGLSIQSCIRICACTIMIHCVLRLAVCVATPRGSGERQEVSLGQLAGLILTPCCSMCAHVSHLVMRKYKYIVFGCDKSRSQECILCIEVLYVEATWRDGMHVPIACLQLYVTALGTYCGFKPFVL